MAAMEAATQSQQLPQSTPRPFGPAQAWIIFFSYVGVQLAIGFAVGFAMALGYAIRHHGKMEKLAEAMVGPVAAGALLGVIVAGVVAYGLARRAARRDPYQPSLALFGWTGSTPQALLTAALAGLALGAVYLGLFALFPPHEGKKLGLLARSLSGGGWPLYAWALFAVAIAPPVEEFVFRGVMWAGLARSWRPGAAAFAITAAFLLLHVTEAGGYPIALVAIGSLGLMALVARVLTGSLVPAIAMHSSYNSVIVAAVLGGNA